MVTVYDVEANKLIEKTAEKLKELGLKKPPFIGYVKSGAHKERLPEQEDFWYLRCASLLRQAYIRETIGVSRLRVHYGGRKHRGVKRERKVKAGGAIIRRGLQELEKMGLIEKKKKGRGITGKGRALLDRVAFEIKKA